MRFRIAIILAVSVLLTNLCACSAKKVDYTLSPFSQKVSFTANNSSFSGVLTFASADDITFEVTEPQGISNMKYTLRKGENSIVYDTLEVPFDKSNGSIFKLLDIISFVSVAPFQVSNQGEDIISGEGYEIRFDCAEKKIISIQSDDYHFSFG